SSRRCSHAGAERPASPWHRGCLAGPPGPRRARLRAVRPAPGAGLVPAGGRRLGGGGAHGHTTPAKGRAAGVAGMHTGESFLAGGSATRPGGVGPGTGTAELAVRVVAADPADVLAGVTGLPDHVDLPQAPLVD